MISVWRCVKSDTLSCKPDHHVLSRWSLTVQDSNLTTNQWLKGRLLLNMIRRPRKIFKTSLKHNKLQNLNWVLKYQDASCMTNWKCHAKIQPALLCCRFFARKIEIEDITTVQPNCINVYRPINYFVKCSWQF